jgi:hypothetical protein
MYDAFSGHIFTAALALGIENNSAKTAVVERHMFSIPAPDCDTVGKISE